MLCSLHGCLNILLVLYYDFYLLVVSFNFIFSHRMFYSRFRCTQFSSKWRQQQSKQPEQQPERRTQNNMQLLHNFAIFKKNNGFSVCDAECAQFSEQRTSIYFSFWLCLRHTNSYTVFFLVCTTMPKPMFNVMCLINTRIAFFVVSSLFIPSIRPSNVFLPIFFPSLLFSSFLILVSLDSLLNSARTIARKYSSMLTCLWYDVSE